VVDHNVVRLHISVHYPLRVAEVQRFEQLVDVVADVVVLEFGVQGAEVGVVDMLEYEGRGFGLGVADYVE